MRVLKNQINLRKDVRIIELYLDFLFSVNLFREFEIKCKFNILKGE